MSLPLAEFDNLHEEIRLLRLQIEKLQDEIKRLNAAMEPGR